jgi:hypothetical protein
LGQGKSHAAAFVTLATRLRRAKEALRSRRGTEPQMNADARRQELNVITEKIIGCAYELSKVLDGRG